MRLSFRIYGKVQGVGYRWFVKEAAENARGLRLGAQYAGRLGGGEAQGGIPALDGFLKEIKTGHPGPG